MTGLDFEKPILELEAKIKELRHSSSSKNINLAPEIQKIEDKLARMKENIYNHLTPWQRVQIARHPQRPYTLDYIRIMFDDYTELHGDRLPPRTFVNAHTLAPEEHLAMQAALQPFVDNSISKTINVPLDYAFERFQDIYERAYDQGLKGCTTFRPNPVTGAVLTGVEEGVAAPHCCSVEREAD